MSDFSIGIAFIAGLLSFFSPCTLPLIPAYLCYISGVKLSQVKSERVRILANSISFVLGFSVVFIAFGVFASYIGSSVIIIRSWAPRIGGLILVLFGLYMLHILRIPYLDKQGGLMPRFHSFSLLTSFVFGATFAMGWTPCLTPVISGVMLLATASGTMLTGTILLVSFAFGLGVPFVLAGFFTGYLLKFVSQENRWLRYYYIIAGLMLILLGIYLMIKRDALSVI
jgi:cytochrome c-type biogenesis protein